MNAEISAERLADVTLERLALAEASAKLNMETIALQQQEIRKLENVIERVRAQLDTPMSHRLIVECIDSIVNPRGSNV